MGGEGVQGLFVVAGQHLFGDGDVVGRHGRDPFGGGHIHGAHRANSQVDGCQRLGERGVARR